MSQRYLVIESSARGEASASSQLANRFLSALTRREEVQIVSRQVGSDPLPALDGNMLGAWFAAPDQRTAQQAQLVALSDELIAELRATDTLVIATGMINFSITSQLKTYLDLVLRAGETFRYTASGPEGLVTGKQAIILAATGGVYSEGPAAAADFMVPYLKQVLAFIGITEVSVIRAEGLAMGPDAAAAGMERAFAQIDTLLGPMRQAA